MFCDYFRCRVGRVEGLVVDRSRNDGVIGGMWRKRGEKEKVCQFLTQPMWEISHLTGCMKCVYVGKYLLLFWHHFDRHLCIVLLIVVTKNVLKSFCNMEQISHLKMYEIIKNIEREIERDLRWDSESLAMCEEENEFKERITKRVLDF